MSTENEEGKTVFTSYAREDDPLRRELDKHLSQLEKKNLIKVWHHHDISAGTEWESEINKQLDMADIILLLISPDFMVSEYCNVEMRRAMERHERGEAIVVPIIVRPVHWQDALFGKLRALPTGEKPIKSSEWRYVDEAFLDVVEGLRKIIEGPLQTKNVVPLAPLSTVEQPDSQEKKPDPLPAHRNSSLTEEKVSYLPPSILPSSVQFVSSPEQLHNATVKLHIARSGIYGSGFFVTPDLILTCAHVVQTASTQHLQIAVTWGKTDFDAEVVNITSTDYPNLALLKLTTPSQHPWLPLDADVKVNDPLYAYGYPVHYPHGASATFTYEKKTEASNILLKFHGDEIRPGFSGAPLLNLRTGKVCAVVCVSLGRYAIPITCALEAFPKLQSGI